MISLFTASVFSGIAPCVAALVALFFLKQLPTSSKLSTLLLGASTGLMFAIATLELIPEAISLSQSTPGDDGHHHKHSEELHDAIQQMQDHHSHKSHSIVQQNLTGCGIAFAILLLLQQLLASSDHSHSHGSQKKHEEDFSGEESRSSPPASLRLLTLLALAVHSLIDGLVIAGGYKASEGVGARVALAIILHKIPDGVLLTTLIVVGKMQAPKDTTIMDAAAPVWDKTTLLTVVALSVMTPLGALITTYLLSTPDYNGFILAFGAGTFLFIATIEIIPELLREKTPFITLASLIAGYLSFFAFEYFVHFSEGLAD